MRFLTFLLIYFLAFCIHSQKNIELEKILDNPEIHPVIYAVSVKEADSKKTLFEKNSHQHLIPASTFKLLISLTVLEKLGPSFKFKTEIYYSGKILNGSLDGDLLIKGYGDPTIESRFFNYHLLQNIMQDLKKNKIDSIKGKVIVLNNYFQPKVNGNWTYEDVNNYYAAIPYPISIFDNQYHLYCESKKSDEDVQVLKISPQYENQPKIKIISNYLVAKEGGDNAYIYGDPLGYEKRLEGSIPPYQKNFSIEGSLPDPARIFAETLMQNLLDNKIYADVTKYRIYNDTFNLSGSTLLNTYYSPTLSEIMYFTNLHSINLFAEAMMYAFGNGNYELAKKELLNFAIQMGIPQNEIFIDDACGLSRLNGISANALTALLCYAYKSKNFSVFFNSLPTAGESGTMKNFTDDLPLKGNLKCKTGYFQRVRSFAGYLKTQSGKTLAVSLMFNNFNISNSKIKQITKTFFETVYNNY